jgi:transaldolase
VWLDDLSRPLIETGGLAKLVDDGEIVGITTNPTIFAKAIGAGSGYEHHSGSSRCAARPSPKPCGF